MAVAKRNVTFMSEDICSREGISFGRMAVVYCVFSCWSLTVCLFLTCIPNHEILFKWLGFVKLSAERL